MEWLGHFCNTLSRKEIEEPCGCYIAEDTQALFGDLYYVTNRPFQTLNFQNLKLMDQVFRLFVCFCFLLFCFVLRAERTWDPGGAQIQTPHWPMLRFPRLRFRLSKKWLHLGSLQKQPLWVTTRLAEMHVYRIIVPAGYIERRLRFWKSRLV